MMDSVLSLSFCRLRLLVRNRAGLLVAAMLPIITGVLMGIAARGEANAAPHGLFAVLITSSMLLMVAGLRSDGILPSSRCELVTSGVVLISDSLSTLAVLAIQVVLYTLTVGVTGAGPAPALPITLLAMATALAVGAVASTLIPRRRD